MIEASARALRVALGVLVVAGAVVLLPLWAPVLIAAWTAELVRPLARRLERAVGRRRVAAALTIGILLVVLVPFSLAVASLVLAGLDLVRRVSASDQLQAALQALVADGGGADLRLADLLDPRHLVALVRQHGAEAWSLAKTFAGATADAIVQLFVYLVATHAFLSEGEAGWAWLVPRLPLPGRVLERLRATFQETGRGLVIGVGGTALAQALVALVAYTALGVPRALILAQLTFVAAFIPSFGTALVWVPVAAGLALSGQLVTGAILTALGVLVIGTIDNILRPVLARWGNLALPVSLQILAVFGGFAVFGAFGFLLGPLLVRLAREALDLLHEERLAAGASETATR